MASGPNRPAGRSPRRNITARSVAAALGLPLLVFHARLLGDRIAAGEWTVGASLRWAVAIALVAAGIRLFRRAGGMPPPRTVAVLALAVLLLHAGLGAPIAPPPNALFAIASSAVLLVALALAGLLVASARDERRRPRSDQSGRGSSPLAAGFADALASRPPPSSARSFAAA